jgi:plasmid stabilization system protein ParE
VHNILVDVQAQEGLDSAKRSIYRFFEGIQDSEKGLFWAEQFVDEIEKQYELLRQNPERYPICTLYPLNIINEEYRYFKVMWFIVFYLFDEENVYVMQVSSSKSDLSRIVPL